MPQIVPNRLFFSVLPTGEREFSCLVRLPDGAVHAVIGWSLRGKDGGGWLRSERPLSDDEMAKGRAVLSALVPADWPDSILTVTVAGEASTRSVSGFAQRERFGLPLDGDALVAGGHRIGEPHRIALGVPSQQFGWDLVPLRPGDLALMKTALSDPPRCVDMACFGRPVLSPAAGVVIAAQDDLPDAELLAEPQPPAGAELVTWALGNHVIIKHEDTVHSCLAHLKSGSVPVAVGQEVKAATPVGAVGSSGHAIGPHLHLHFMDGADVIRSAPLPIKLTVEGETYAPLSGQIFGP
jgi:hypothetical protein